MTQIMGIVNLTPDSFFQPSRVSDASAAVGRIALMAEQGADIIDLGAVSSRPGATYAPLEEEWRRLEPTLRLIAADRAAMPEFSIDTFRAEIVRRAFDTAGPFIVNDISAGEDDPGMLATVGRLGLSYVAMHKRGNPGTMDRLTGYGILNGGVTGALRRYFKEFDSKASDAGISDWILDPGLGFAKTDRQCLRILDRLEEIRVPGRRILIGAADKRFTRRLPGGTEEAHETAIRHGADIIRVHDVPAARATLARVIQESRKQA